MSETSKHGGRRTGAGRPRGSLSRRSLESIQAVAERYPDWTPLLHFAAVANDESLSPEIRLDAAKAAAPYLHPKPKSIEFEPDAAVELEKRLAAGRTEAAAQPNADHIGLAERLLRATARLG